MIFGCIKLSFVAFVGCWLRGISGVALVLLTLSAATAREPLCLSRASTQPPDPSEPTLSSQIDRSYALRVDLVRSLAGGDASFNPRSNTIITTSVGSARLWDVETGNLIATLDGYQDISKARFTSDGRFVVTIGKDKDQRNIVTRIWDGSSGKLQASLTGYAVFVGASPPMAITVHNNELKFWDASTGELKKTVPAYTKQHSDWRFFLDSAISPDGGYIVAYRGKSLPLWNTNTGKLIAELTPPPDKRLFNDYRGRMLEVYQARFAPDGQTVAAVDSFNRVELWQAATGRLRSTLAGHFDSIYNIEFSADGRLLATASRDGTVRVWDIPTGQLRNTLKAGKEIACRVEFDRDASLLAVGYQNQVRLWDVNTGGLRSELPRDDGSTATSFGTYLNGVQVHFSPDGRLLLTMSDKAIQVWETNGGKFIESLEGARPPVAFSPNGKFFLTAGNDKSALLWQVSSR